ncbi:hypothetical protein MSPP1_003300 [Malassezia sp. CBS 17886]|nr:hypothetical protein MSPP1_003300 [Malassezia sp. CBS 17886]
MQISYYLENKGSVARDHLALERTFLAWMRTSLSLVGIGIAIAQLFRLPELVVDDGGTSASGLLSFLRRDARTMGNIKLRSLRHIGTPIGVCFVGIGILILLTGSQRFFRVQMQLLKGIFTPSRVEVFSLALLTSALLFATLGVLIAVAAGTL